VTIPHKAPGPCSDASGGLVLFVIALVLLNAWSLWRWRSTLKAWGRSLEREERSHAREAEYRAMLDVMLRKAGLLDENDAAN
jgi:heme exporter protein D